MLSRPRSTIAQAARVFATLSLARHGRDGRARSAPSRRTCRSCATPRSRRWCATMRGRSSRRRGWRMTASTSFWSTIQSFNAFVTGRRMFINTGALMMAETPNEIIGVIAHEAGHIAGGHQQKLRDQLERAKTMAIIATLLGRRRHRCRCHHQQPRPCRRRHGRGGRRRRDGTAQHPRLSAHRGDDRRPLGDHLSQRHRPVRHGHAEDVRAASRRRCRCRARRSIPTGSAIRCRRTVSPISKCW